MTTDLYRSLGTPKSGIASETGRGTVTEAVESADQDWCAVDRLEATLPVS